MMKDFKRLIVMLSIVVGIVLRFFGYWEKDYNLDEVNNFPSDKNHFGYGVIKDIFFRVVLFLVLKFGDDPVITRLISVIPLSISIIVLKKIIERFPHLWYVIPMYSVSPFLIQLSHQVRPISFATLILLLNINKIYEKKYKAAIFLMIIGIFCYYLYIPYYFSFVVYFFIRGIYPFRYFILTIAIIFSISFGHFFFSFFGYEKVFGYPFQITIPSGGIFYYEFYYEYIVFCLRVLSGMFFDFTFYIFLILFFLGAVKNYKEFLILFLLPSVLIVISTLFYVNYFHPRYLLPTYIVSLFFIADILRGIGKLMSLLSYLLKLLIILSSLVTNYIYFTSDIGFEASIDLRKVKIEEGEIIFVTPFFGREAKAYYISAISYFYKDKSIKFLVEEESFYKNILSTVSSFYHKLDNIIKIDDVEFPAKVVIILPKPEIYYKYYIKRERIISTLLKINIRGEECWKIYGGIFIRKEIGNKRELEKVLKYYSRFEGLFTFFQ